MNQESAQATLSYIGLLGGAFVLTAMFYEWLAGKYKDGRKTKTDWKMTSLGLLGVVLFQRPLMMIIVFSIGAALFPHYAESFKWVDQEYFWSSLLAIVLIDELIHGYFHKFAHDRKPKNKTLQKIQNFYKGAHRVHHTNGGNDGKGEINVMQTFAVNWCWFLILPNYILGIVFLYLGFYEAFFWAFIIKNIWGLHNHTNWNYDLYFLNHKYAWVRKTMYALCHVIVFPTMHHQHHSRSKNSARNMQNIVALYDWLLWGTLAIETEKPKISGWRQNKKEEDNVFRRWLNMGQYQN